MKLDGELINYQNLNFFIPILIFIRINLIILVLPVLGEGFLSTRAKVIISLVLTSIVTPACVPYFETVILNRMSIIKIIFLESIIGIFLGLVIRMIILTIQTSGAIAAQTTSLAQIHGTPNLDPLPAIGHILTISALALLTVLDFHSKVCEFIIFSYSMFPPNSFLSVEEIVGQGVERVSHSFNMAFKLVAPFLIVSVLYNSLLGVISRAMPQLMVAFVGAPLITLCSIVLLYLCVSEILLVWISDYNSTF